MGVAEPAAPKSVEKWTVKAEKLKLYKEPQQTTEVEYDGEYKEGDQVDVVERLVTDNGRLRLRASQGWFSEKTEEGEVIAERTRGKRAPAAGDAPPADAPVASDDPPADTPAASDDAAKTEL